MSDFEKKKLNTLDNPGNSPHRVVERQDVPTLEIKGSDVSVGDELTVVYRGAEDLPQELFVKVARISSMIKANGEHGFDLIVVDYDDLRSDSKILMGERIEAVLKTG